MYTSQKRVNTFLPIYPFLPILPSIPVSASSLTSVNLSLSGLNSVPDTLVAETCLTFHLVPSVKIGKSGRVTLWTCCPYFQHPMSFWLKLIKKERTESRRRAIPKTFQNWLQAFWIYAAVLGKRFPEKCSGLFQHLDSVSEAF